MFSAAVPSNNASYIHEARSSAATAARLTADRSQVAGRLQVSAATEVQLIIRGLTGNTDVGGLGCQQHSLVPAHAHVCKRSQQTGQAQILSHKAHCLVAMEQMLTQ